MPAATARSQRFSGLPPQLFQFLEGLEADNSKSYWTANTETWTNSVKGPVDALMQELEPEFGPLRTFRPNRDVRFSKDKSPYKTWVGVTTSERAVGGIGSFLHIEASGVQLATGAMALASDQLDRYRKALVDPVAGREFGDLREQLERKSLEVGPGVTGTYKRVPAGFPKDHARADLLLWKGAVVMKSYDHATWMHTRKVLDRVREVWAGADPLVEWINRHIGPSTTPARRPSVQ